MKGRIGSWQRLITGEKDGAVSETGTAGRLGRLRREDGSGPSMRTAGKSATSSNKGPTAIGSERPLFGRLGPNQTQFLRYLFLLLAVGVVLMSLNKGVRDVDTDLVDNTTEATVPVATPSEVDYARALEQLVQDALMQLHGVNRVHVAITLAGGPRKVLAEHVTSERRTSEVPGAMDEPTGFVIDERSSSQPVLLRSDQARQENPIVLVEFLPAIEGVVVVTDAAEDSRVRLEIGRAVSTLLGVAAHRVYVLPQRFQ